jgi:hypothetical protein
VPVPPLPASSRMSNLMRCPLSLTSPLIRTADACSVALRALATMPVADSFSTPLGASARDVVAVIAGESAVEPQPVITIAVAANDTSSLLSRTHTPGVRHRLLTTEHGGRSLTRGTHLRKAEHRQLERQIQHRLGGLRR